MNAAITSFVEGFPYFLAYVGTAAGLLITGCLLYVILTPQKEMDLLKQGNASAGMALGGVILGLAIPMGVCLASSISLYDMIIWGVVSILIQILCFRFVDLILHGLPQRIENDEAGAAILLVAVKLASAILLAAALWDPNLSRMAAG